MACGDRGHRANVGAHCPHTPDSPRAPRPHGLLAIRPVASPWASTDVPLHPSGPGEFEGSVVVPTGGSWMLVAFPDRAGWSSPEVPGYPDTIFFSVRGEPTPSPPSRQEPESPPSSRCSHFLLLRARRLHTGRAGTARSGRHCSSDAPLERERFPLGDRSPAVRLPSRRSSRAARAQRSGPPGWRTG